MLVHYVICLLSWSVCITIFFFVGLQSAFLCQRWTKEKKPQLDFCIMHTVIQFLKHNNISLVKCCFFYYQTLFVPSPDSRTKYVVLHVSRHAEKSPWTSLVRKNALRVVTVPSAGRSEMITNVCPSHGAPVTVTDAPMILGLWLNPLTALNGEQL